MKKKILVVMMVLSVSMLIGCPKKTVEVEVVDNDIKPAIYINGEIDFDWVQLTGDGNKFYLYNKCAEGISSYDFETIDNEVYLTMNNFLGDKAMKMKSLDFDNATGKYIITFDNSYEDPANPKFVSFKVHESDGTALWWNDFEPSLNGTYIRDVDIEYYETIDEPGCEEMDEK